MRSIVRILVSLAFLLLAGVRAGAWVFPWKDYNAAVDLYEKGQWSEAELAFRTVGTPDCQAYAVLCAIRGGTPGYEAMLKAHLSMYPKGVLNDDLHYYYAMRLFDEGRYAECLSALDEVRARKVPSRNKTEYLFKKAYCLYSLDKFFQAMPIMNEVSQRPHSQYTAPSRYLLGYMLYLEGQTDKALPWLEKAAKDARFASLAGFYILECRFLKKDYGYVIEKGEAMLADAAPERKAHISRLLSESFLVLGDVQKAGAYYRAELSSDREMTRADFFHAGSVLYALGDYKGAVEKFTAMGERKDSIGQIASYQLGNACVKTGDKVSALAAFEEAAKYGYDPQIQEDAAFNSAKLCFDINHDKTGFLDYMSKYSEAGRKQDIYSYMAVCDLYNRDFVSAIESFDKIDDLTEVQKGNYAKANFLRGAELYRASSWTDAIPYFRTAGFYYPKNDPFNQLSRYWLAESCSRIGKYGEACGIFTDLYNRSALADTPEGESLSFNVAWAWYRSDEFEKAAKWFDICLRDGVSRYRKDALVRRADCDFLQGKYEDAVKSYQAVMDEFFNVDDPYPYWRQGMAYGLCSKPLDKQKTLSTILGASADAPMYQEVLYEYGRSCLDNRNCPKARDAFGRLRDTARDTVYVAKALIGLGMVCRNEKDYDGALEELKKVPRMMPGTEVCQEALAVIESIYHTRRQSGKYLEYLEEENISADGTSLKSREELVFETAEQAYMSGNYDSAVSLCRRYLEESPEGDKAPQARFYLAESARMLGDKETAAAAYAEALKTLPDGSFRERSAASLAEVNSSLERYDEAYDAYCVLDTIAVMPQNRKAAGLGKMRSAWNARNYASAVVACAAVRKEYGSEPDILREAQYVEAKSLLSLSRRSEAMELFRVLSQHPTTVQGAEASYMLAQDALDRGDCEDVEKVVYEFSQSGTGQMYWLAKAYILLGDSFALKGNVAQARSTYESVRDGYASSSAGDDILETVKEKLEKLEGK